MTTTVVCCRPEDPIEKATQVMKDNQVRRVPGVDEHQKIQGIVSMADVVRRGDVDSAETRETLETVSEPTPEPSKPRAKSKKSQREAA